MSLEDLNTFVILRWVIDENIVGGYSNTVVIVLSSFMVIVNYFLFYQNQNLQILHVIQATKLWHPLKSKKDYHSHKNNFYFLLITDCIGKSDKY